MPGNRAKGSATGIVTMLLVLLNAVVMQQGLIDHPNWYALLYVSIPLLLISIVAFRKKYH